MKRYQFLLLTAIILTWGASYVLPAMAEGNRIAMEKCDAVNSRLVCERILR